MKWQSITSVVCSLTSIIAHGVYGSYASRAMLAIAARDRSVDVSRFTTLADWFNVVSRCLMLGAVGFGLLVFMRDRGNSPVRVLILGLAIAAALWCGVTV